MKKKIILQAPNLFKRRKLRAKHFISEAPGGLYPQSFLFLKAVDKLRGAITSNRDVSVCETRKLLQKKT